MSLVITRKPAVRLMKVMINGRIVEVPAKGCKNNPSVLTPVIDQEQYPRILEVTNVTSEYLEYWIY